MSAIFKNPFYFGLIAHNLLEGKLINGNHEKVTTRDIFLKVNDVQKQNPHGFSWNAGNNKVRMKIFLHCEGCGGSMTEYVVKKKGIWYYKCRKKGCCNNKATAAMHTVFEEILICFELKE